MALSSVVVAIVVVFIITVIVVILYFVGLYNKLVAFKNNINRSFSKIDVLLKQRHDELPRLIETCKGYMQHEQKTLQAVTEARTAFMRANTPAEKAKADNLVSGALKSLFAVVEKYPDLRANANFLQLQGRIADVETKVAAQRAAYNEDVNTFNSRIAHIPASLVAGFKGLRPLALFQVAEADRKDVKVSFN
jgi:LemA protein